MEFDNRLGLIAWRNVRLYVGALGSWSLAPLCALAPFNMSNHGLAKVPTLYLFITKSIQCFLALSEPFCHALLDLWCYKMNSPVSNYRTSSPKHKHEMNCTSCTFCALELIHVLIRK